MPGSSGSDGGRKGRGLWEAVGGITAVASLVAAVVFGVAELTDEPQDEIDIVSADEGLELVDVEFAAKAVDVAVLEEVRKGERPRVSAKPGKGGIDTRAYHPLVVTLRNPADDPAVLTGVKVVVHEILAVPSCGVEQSSATSISINFDFRFPVPFDSAWSRVNPQNFTVAPHAVDALSITMGPELSDDTSHVWRFSVYGQSKGGDTHWADGLGSDVVAGSAETYSAYVWRDALKRGKTEQDVQTCAAQRLDSLEQFAGQDANLIVHPGFTGLMDAFRTAAQG